jgi:phosphate transport system protein
MREEFRGDLLEVGRLLVSMADAARTAMRNATAALLGADRAGAEAVIARDADIDGLYRNVEDLVQQLLARQAPVASDLRLVVTALHVAADLERMGDLSAHVAKTALRRYPAPAVPAEVSGIVSEMAQIADRIAGKITTVLSAPDPVRAAELERDDDAMDALHRQLFEVLLGPSWPHGVEPGIDCALLGRFYERYADHAVNAGGHVVFMVTGEQVAG